MKYEYEIEVRHWVEGSGWDYQQTIETGECDYDDWMDTNTVADYLTASGTADRHDYDVEDYQYIITVRDPRDGHDCYEVRMFESIAWDYVEV